MHNGGLMAKVMGRERIGGSLCICGKYGLSEFLDLIDPCLGVGIL
jgi:hypothetical protein